MVGSSDSPPMEEDEGVSKMGPVVDDDDEACVVASDE